jgi:membrane protein required for colicin V production
MPFTMLDGILIFVMLVSAVLAMIRGFTREVFAIGSWVAAAAATYFFWEPVLPYTQRYIEDSNIALGVTIAGIFFITLLVVSLITMRLSDFVLDSRAGPLDRTLGFIFGAARGLILVVVAFLFLNFFIAEERQPEWITQAATNPWLQNLGDGLMNSLPDDPEAEIMERLRGPEQAATPPGGDDVEPNAAPEPSGAEAPAEADPDYATEDQNQLERQIESPPPD